MNNIDLILHSLLICHRYHKIDTIHQESKYKEIKNFMEKEKDLDNRLLELKNNFENEYSGLTEKI